MTAIGRLEQRGVFHAGIASVRVGERWLDMPDAFEFPRVWRAVVEQMFADFAFVNEFVALALGHALRRHGRAAAGRIPSLAAVVGALHRSEERRVGKEGRSRWSAYP